jgi:transcriptional regulator with GAF, ATPase, and Fis domain
MQFRMESVEAEKKLLEEKNKELQSVSHDVILLSEMGQEITSLLSVESINKTVYEHLSEIMEVSGFGIGVSDDGNNTLTFPGYIEDGEIFESVTYRADDPHRLASVCYSQAKEILIGSNEEVAQYTGKQSAPVAGRPVESIIYLPLKLDNKKVGVITVQSFNKNVYTEYHLNLLRNLGVYAAIALQNAGMYGRLEQIVEERSQEILRQKEEIERSYYNTQLLSEIGQQITSNLQLDKIFRMLYDNVNKLMPAECFGVRIYHHDRQEIEYKFEIEKGIQDTAPFAVSMANDDNYSVWCVKNRQVIFLNDNQNEYHKYTSKIVVPTGEMPHSLIFYPMMIGEKVIGVITVQSFKKFAYSNYHIDILKTLGTYTAIALENASLYENLEEKVMERTMEVVKKKEEVERSYENTRLLSEIGKEISSTLDINEIIQRVYHRIDKLMDAAAFGIGIYRPEHNDLYHPCVMENGEKLPPFSFLLDQDRIASRCFKENREFVINNWMEEYTKYVKTDVPPVEGENPVSLIYIPLVSRYKTMGVLSVQSFQANAYSDYHLDIVRNLSVYIANSLENASLYESLELRVEERTEEITKAYENTRLLGQISKDISSSLSIETIIEKVYRNVNTLMDAASFGIGIFQPETRALVFPGFIEKGDKLDNVIMHIDDDRIASWCFKNQREVVINNHFEDYKKYVKTILQPVAGKTSASIIYLPLFSKENIIGVITVQSYELNAYSDYQVNMLRQLSHNVAIAIENASLYESLEDKVRERTAEVVKQKEVIEEKNKHITDSIVYAKRIQRAILPPEDVFKAHLRNSFVLYKPKDIVSGDFYWLEKKGNKILFAVVDCTGHGVPGAFMSIIGYNGLNQIVNEYHITQPAEILNRLNKIITGTLRQQAHESKIRDGMDISVCSIDLDQNKLEYAGANNPIFILRNQEVIEVRADKKPIGNFVGEEEFSFTNKELDLFPNDRLYLFSDGYADQFGGPHGKKLKYNTFRQLLIDHHHRPMDEQKVILDRMFEAWRGDLEQIDDVCVIGVAV